MQYFLKLTEKLEATLFEIGQQNLEILELTRLSIMECRKSLYDLKKEVLRNGFATKKEEIQFFKSIKQIPLTQLIYFSKIHSFELQFPKADVEAQLKFTRKKIHKANRFLKNHKEFLSYMDSGHTHFDKAYYTRRYLNNHDIMDYDSYLQDTDFCTCKDILLGKLSAYKLLLGYLEKRLVSLSNPLHSLVNGHPLKNKLPWPFGDTAFAEFVYALFYAGLKNENLTIIQISRKLQEVFDVEIKDIYKLFQEMKNRKKSRTVFLDKLTMALLEEMNRMDAKEFS